MAMMNDVIAKHFHVGECSFRDPELIVSTLDTGLYSAGKIVASLRDQVLHGSPSTGTSEVDVDEVSSGLEALLAFLGHLGFLVDQLEERARAERLAARAGVA